MSVVWIFLDGVGLGTDDPSSNPWAAVPDPTLIAVEGRGPTWPGAVMKPLDANLGVEGLPQSATGTTALFTGINAPREIGRHASGFPGRDLQAIIAEHSLFRRARERGLDATFANAYNEAYFRRPANRQSVTTHAYRASERPFRMMEDYRAGRAVFHDLTGELIRVQGNEDRLRAPRRDARGNVVAPIEKKRVFKRYVRDRETFADMLGEMDLQVIDPVEAGRRIAALAREHDIVVFEYVKTDMMGHTRDPQWAADVVDEVMTFLRRVLDGLDPERDTLLITSDHGNSEDLNVRTHTRNPVPAVAVGPAAEAILAPCRAITDLADAVLNEQAPRNG